MLLFDTQQIGNRLLAIRKRLGLTQSEAAELCGLSGRAYAHPDRPAHLPRVPHYTRRNSDRRK